MHICTFGFGFIFVYVLDINWLRWPTSTDKVFQLIYVTFACFQWFKTMIKFNMNCNWKRGKRMNGSNLDNSLRNYTALIYWFILRFLLFYVTELCSNMFSETHCFDDFRRLYKTMILFLLLLITGSQNLIKNVFDKFPNFIF